MATDAVKRARIARYDLYTLAVLELLLVVTLLSFLIASGSHLYGIAIVHLLSITAAFALPSAIRWGLPASMAPAAFMPSLLADVLIIFSLVVGFIECIDGRQSHSLDLALGANVCQGSTADSGFVEALLVVIASSLFVTVLQEAVASSRLGGAHDAAAGRLTVEVVRGSLLFFTMLWFWVRGTHLFAVIATAALGAAILDVVMRVPWATALSAGLDAFLLLPPLIHHSWVCPGTDWICPHDGSLSAIAMLVIGAARVSLGVYVAALALGVSPTKRRRRQLHPRTASFTLVAHLVGSLAAVTLLHATGNHVAAIICWATLALHLAGAMLIVSMRPARRSLDASLGLCTIALIMDAGFAISAFVALGDGCALESLWVFSGCIGAGEAGAIAGVAVALVTACAFTIAKAVDMRAGV